MPDVVGTGVIRLEVDKAGAQADIDAFVAQTDAKLKSTGSSSGKAFGDGISSGADKADTSVKKLNTDLDNTKKKAESAAGKNKNEGVGLLLGSIVALGPLIAPVGAVAAAALGSMAVGAGVAALAVKGISAEIKAGTAEGKEYSTGLNTLNSDLQQLERTAASKFLSPFQDAVSDIHEQLPEVNGIVSQFSTILGETATFGVDALVSGLRIAEPVLLSFAKYADGVVQSFDGWVNDGGLQGFVDYSEKELPQVEETLGELGSTAITLVKSLAPLGGASLTGLRLLAEVINSLPIPIAQELTTIIAAGFGFKEGAYLIQSGIKTFNDLSSTIDKVIAKKFALAAADAAEGAAATAEGAEDLGAGTAASASTATKGGTGISGLASTLSGVGVTAGIAGVAIAGVTAVVVGGSLAWSNYENTVKQNQKATDALTISLEANKGALDDQGKTALSTAPAFKDASGALKTLGLSQDTLSEAASGNTEALNEVNKAVDGVNTKYTAVSRSASGYTSATAQQRGAVEDLQIDLKTLTDDYNKSKAAADAQASLLQTELVPAYKTTADAVTHVNTIYGLATDTANKYVNALGITNQEITDGDISIGKYSDSLDLAIKAQNESDASVSALFNAMETFSTSAGTAADKATLLGQVLVSSQGDLLSYTGAMADGYAATQNLVTGFDKAEKSSVNLKTGVIDFTKAGAGPLVTQLQGMQTAAEAAAEATYQHEVATKGDNAALQDAQDVFEQLTGGALTKNAKQLGLTAQQAKNLSDQYFTFDGKTVTTTVQSIGLNDINTTLEAIGNQLSILTHTPFEINAQVNFTSNVPALIAALPKNVQAGGELALKGYYQKDGGIMEYYANGGMRENHIAQIAPAGAMRTFAEPETGGEAYIPLSPTKRARSTEIWRQTGTRLGQSFADGGFSGASAGDAVTIADLWQAMIALASRPVSIQVDKREIARASNNGNLVLNRGRGQ